MHERLNVHLNLLGERYPVLVPMKEQIAAFFDVIRESYENGGKLIIGGNGGSCSDAEHIVGELMKGFKLLRPLDDVARQKLCAVDPVLGAELADKLQGGLPAVALSSHPALNTAYLNDVSGDMMYAQQVNSLGKPGDVFLAITTSGTALNLRYAAVTAKAKGMKVLALTGKTGGAFNDLADINLVMPCNETYQIQELHLPVYHCLCLLLEDHFFGA
jgi:D-sedoheptulose 7-phosphate isomerase